MENEQLRTALKLWAKSDQIERYQYGIISERFKLVVAWLGIGAFSGFVFGFVLGIITK